METKGMTSNFKGLILALIQVVLSITTYVLIEDMQKQQAFGWVTYALIVGGIVWACFTYAKDQDHNVTFGNVFSHGFKVTMVMTLIVLAYSILAITVIFPEMKEKALNVAREQMMKDSKITETQIEQAIEMTKKFFFPFVIGGAIIVNLFWGAIGGLLGAAIVKKNPNPTPFEKA